MRLVTIVSLLLIAAPVTAGVPNAANSYVSAPVVFCPAGDAVLSMIIRKIVPVPNAEVVLEFHCPGIQFPPVLGNEGYVFMTPTVIVQNTDGLGRVGFAIRAGGTCPAGGMAIYANSVPFGTRAVASPDQDGNLGVGANDLALAEAKLGNADPTADFDGDGTVTSADLDILRAHLGHHAPGMATPVSSRSWGAIKLLYQ